MLEKLKDFFYDCSDFILGLVIGIAIISVVTWKLMGIMLVPFNLDVFAAFNDKETHVVESEDINNDNKPDDLNNTGDYIEPPSKTSESQTIEVLPIEHKEVVIEIPKGATGYSIAKLLKSENLIEDQSSFVSRVEELGLGPKLRFGSFKISSQDSLDDIIYILTGTK